MAFARALRNGIVAFVVAYLVAGRVGGEDSPARRIASMTAAAVFLVSFLQARGGRDGDDGGDGDGDEERGGGSGSGGRTVPATA